LKPQTYWINTILVLNYVELKLNLCYFSIDIWIDFLIALKQHNFSIELNINHFKVSNQHYLKLNVDQYFKSIDSIDTKIALNQHYFAIETLALYLLVCLVWNQDATDTPCTKI
jgi:hypothetical protein